MNTVGDLRIALDDSVGLTSDVISDTNILLNIVLPVQATASAYLLYQARQNALYQNLTTIERALTVASKLPIVGGPLNLIKLLAHSVSETLDNVDKTLKVVDPLIKNIDAAIGGLSAALTTANLTANAALAVNGARIDVMDKLAALGVLNDSIDLSGVTLDNYTQLVDANDITRSVVDATAPLRANLGALDFSAFGLLRDALDQASDAIGKANSVFAPMQDALDDLNTAMKPVSWAFDMAQSVIDKVVNPVIEAVLDATGLQGLIDEISDRLFGGLDILDDLTAYADRVKVEIEQSDVATMVNDFWNDFSPIFDVDGPMDFTANLGVLEVGNDADGLNILGTNGDDTLVGTAHDDNFAPLEGNDQVDGQGGQDRAMYLGHIEDYRVEFVPDGAGGEMLQVSSRAQATANEGTDTLQNVELLRFSNPEIGDVTQDDVRAFLYTDASNPNLTGTGGTDWLFGDDRNNILNGGAGDDTLFGSRGDDLLIGGPGADRLFGGDGNDDIVTRVDPGDTVVDTIDGGAGHDSLYIDGGLPVWVDFLTGGVDFGAPGKSVFTGIEEVFGSAADDVWLLAEGAQTIHTYGGDDIVRYAGEGDTVWAPDDGTNATDVPLVSFRGGGYAGVRIDAREGAGGDGRWEVSHEGLGADGQPATSQSWLYNIQAVEGTDRSDVFYAIGVSEGSVGTTPGFTFTDNTETFTLDGNAFLGGDGNDVFFASEKKSLFDGGAGFDLVNFSLDYTVADRLSQPGIQSYTINLATGLATELRHQGAAKSDIYLRGIEGVVGTRGDDHIIGNDQANYLYGYLGHDVIEGGGGADYIDASGLTQAELYGGDGNDVIALGAAENATIDGGAGADVLDVIPDQAFRLDVHFDYEAQGNESNPLLNISGWQIDLAAGTATSDFYESFNLGSNVPYTYTASLTSIENALGSNFDDTISGSDAANLLLGRDGSDWLHGYRGNDSLDGGLGNDILRGGQGRDIVSGGDGDDLLRGGYNNDTLRGGAGNDTLMGGHGTDLAVFSGAVDTTVSLATTSAQSTGHGLDILIGIENLTTGAGNDSLQGNGRANVLRAGDGNDMLAGGGGRDVLNGGRGQDVLDGGTGSDILKGGLGSDRFDFHAGFGSDRVVDFQLALDTLQLDSAIWGGGLTAEQVVSTYGSTGPGGTLLDFGGGNTLMIENVYDQTKLAAALSIL